MNRSSGMFPRSFTSFSSPRKKHNETRRKKFAILLMEERNDPKTQPQEPLSARLGPLAAELLPSSSLPESHEDIMTHVGSTLKARIKSHSGLDASVLTAQDVIKKNNRALVPLMYRIATEDFVKSNRSTFKVIECRNSTKLTSDWKPTVPDLLITWEHQVIIVQLQKAFLPYNDFVYAVLRQLDYEWKLRLPRSVFYPNDVCKVEGTEDRDLIVVFPAMPDGDLEISKKMSSLNYELIMMFKRSCMSAMTNYLLMRDMRVGKFQDTMDALASIRTLYQKFQSRLREGGQFRLGSGNVDKGVFASPDTFTSKPLIPYDEKELLSLDDDDGCGDVLLQALPVLPDGVFSGDGLKGMNAGVPHEGGGDAQSMQVPESAKTPFDRFRSDFKSRNSSRRERTASTSEAYGSLHEKLEADLDRIKKIIQDGRNPSSGAFEKIGEFDLNKTAVEMEKMNVKSGN